MEDVFERNFDAFLGLLFEVLPLEVPLEELLAPNLALGLCFFS